MPALFDLVWKPSSRQPTLPDEEDQYPYIGPAVYRGDSYDIRFNLPDEFEVEGTMHAQVRLERLAADEEPGDPIVEFDCTVDVDAVTISLTQAQAATLPDDAYWDIQQVFDDGAVRTWYTGKIKAWGDITRTET